MNEEEKKVIEDMGGEAGESGVEQDFSAKEFTDTIRAYIQKGNISRIIIRHGMNVIVNLPLNAGIVGGIIGAVAAPWAMITAAIAATGFDCTVELIKDNGEIVDISPRKSLHGLSEAIRDAGNSIADEFRGCNGADRSGEQPPADEEIPFEEPEDK